MSDLSYAPEDALVWRDDLCVRVLPLAPGELRFMRAVRAGQSVGAAAASTYSDEPEASLPELLRTLFEGNLFVGAQLEGPRS